MCGLFGLMNYGGKLKADDLSKICNALARESEERGNHATGISYISKGRLTIHKAPLPAHKMIFRIPNDAITVMGHTRHATQGSEKKGINNHPFSGRINNKEAFALAHNGILCNDTMLRKTHKLPKTKIETDSYIAVQLIEQKNILDIDSLRYMAEEVSGSFSFTVMDRGNSLYIVKGDSPVSMLNFIDLGLFVYASTDNILYRGLSQTVLLKHLKAAIRQEANVETVDISDGSIIKIGIDGSMEMSRFEYDIYGSFGLGWWDFDPKIGGKIDKSDDESLDMLKAVASENGIDPDDVDRLYQSGFTVLEIEELVYNPGLLQEYFEEETDELSLY